MRKFILSILRVSHKKALHRTVLFTQGLNYIDVPTIKKLAAFTNVLCVVCKMLSLMERYYNCGRKLSRKKGTHRSGVLISID